MECDFCKKEADYFTVNGDIICEECISKKGYHICTRCGKATTFIAGNLCANCQCEETDN